MGKFTSVKYIFNNINEIQKYYIPQTKTYAFIENNQLLGIKFNFNFVENASIQSGDLDAQSICALNINVGNIDAKYIHCDSIKAQEIHTCDILSKTGIDCQALNARDVYFTKYCLALNSINCRTLNGKYSDRCFSLQGKINVLNSEISIEEKENIEKLKKELKQKEEEIKLLKEENTQAVWESNKLYKELQEIRRKMSNE